MKRIILLVLLVLVIYMIYDVNTEETTIPDLAIRLRVIPNSNDPVDINIKEQVKTYLENNLYRLTNHVHNIEDARMIIQEQVPVIESDIEDIFTENKYDKSYDVNFGYNYFPKKEDNGIKYEEGYYESLVISIGDAKGDNWWCMLFPNMCIVNMEKDYEYKLYFKEILKNNSKKQSK